MLLCISTGRETLADSIKPFETAQRKPSKDGQTERTHREEHADPADRVKTSERRRCYKRHRWPVNERQPEREEARPVALANAPSKAVADQCPVVKTRTRNCRRVLTWFASRWRNHQPKRAEKPHSKFNLARGWTALPRGRRLRLPRRMASGSRQPPQGERQMSARERELGGLPSPDLSSFGRKAGRGLFVFLAVSGARGFFPHKKGLPSFWFPAKTALTVNANHS